MSGRFKATFAPLSPLSTAHINLYSTDIVLTKTVAVSIAQPQTSDSVILKNAHKHKQDERTTQQQLHKHTHTDGGKMAKLGGLL